MTTHSTGLAVLFADISDSTSLYDRLGDTRAHRLIADTLATLSTVATRHGGRTVKNIGDEVMCALDSVEAAAQAACDMHEALADRNESEESDASVAVRIGFSHGPVIVDTDDIHGDTVNIAARMVAQAKAWQIVLPRTTAEALPPELLRSTRFVDYATIKGKGEIELVELLWEHDDLTHMAGAVGSTVAAPAMPGRLRIRLGEHETVLDAGCTALVLGRGRNCDIRIDEPLASRQHVRIERRGDRFLLIDQSTNGTWLRLEDGTEHFLRRDAYVLDGTGRISLGDRIDRADTVVEFTVETH